MAASSIEPPAAAAPEPSSAVQMEEVEEIGAISTSTVKQRPRNQSMLLAAAASTVLTAVDQSNDGRPLRIFSQAGNYSSVSGSAPMDPRVAMDPQLRDTEGLDRSSTHPKFLHSNATSHSWALGAIAELLDNSMDMYTPQHPVTIHVDVKSCPETAGGRMLVVRDNGGGMTKREMLQMMSFGVSRQTTEQRIGRYGNGFKSSSMRLGADALVLSVSRATGSFTAGLLSYTFLRETNAQEVKVPLIEWGANGKPLPGLDAAALANRQRALAKLLKWGPGYDEARLLAELRKLRPFGTAVLVYNLWQTDDGEQELDFFTDSKDIRLRPPAEDDDDGGGKSRKKGSCARTAKGAAAKEKYYGHKVSLRAYASILYLSHPPGFSIVLRGSRVEPRNLKKDLKYKKVENYQPRPRSLPARIFTCGDAKAAGFTAREVLLSGRFTREQVLAAGYTREDAQRQGTYPITVGFVQEAPDADLSGFYVYHNNRLIKPMWKVYSSPSSVGRGVVGLMSIDFVAPSHDKQDFERTDALNKLEQKLKLLTPKYWKEHGRRVGYQAADPLPPSARELREQEAEIAEAARVAGLMGDAGDEDEFEGISDGEDDGAFDARRYSSRLFATRDGKRRCTLPVHMQAYRVEHHATFGGDLSGASASNGSSGAASSSDAALPAAEPGRRAEACPICFDPVMVIDNDVGGRTHCGHVFHTVCILPWAREKGNCATCRQPLLATKARVFAPLSAQDMSAADEHPVAPVAATGPITVEIEAIEEVHPAHASSAEEEGEALVVAEAIPMLPAATDGEGGSAGGAFADDAEVHEWTIIGDGFDAEMEEPPPLPPPPPLSEADAAKAELERLVAEHAEVKEKMRALQRQARDLEEHILGKQEEILVLEHNGH